MHVVVVRHFSVYIWSDLVRVVSDCQFSEARIQSTVVNIDRYAEVIVGVARTLQVEIGFVDGKGKVSCVNRDKDIAAMFDETRRAR